MGYSSVAEPLPSIGEVLGSIFSPAIDKYDRHDPHHRKLFIWHSAATRYGKDESTLSRMGGEATSNAGLLMERVPHIARTSQAQSHSEPVFLSNAAHESGLTPSRQLVPANSLWLCPDLGVISSKSRHQQSHAS